MYFISGIHGVGKTSFAKVLSEKLNLNFYSAGSLIQDRSEKLISDYKKVDSVTDNQMLLLDALREIKDVNYILDGHLCLINNKGIIERIPFDIFCKLGIEQLYIVIDKPRNIFEHLRKRDGKSWHMELIRSFQQKEIEYAKEISELLCIPLEIIYQNRKIENFSVLSEKNIILPIKPCYAKKILNCEKKYEFRKKLCHKEICKIYIYATAPEKKIVGEAEVVEKIKMNKEELWEITQHLSGITSEFYYEYFKSQDYACAYHLGEVTKYETPILLENIGIGFVPQSFVYCGDIR